MFIVLSLLIFASSQKSLQQKVEEVLNRDVRYPKGSYEYYRAKRKDILKIAQSGEDVVPYLCEKLRKRENVHVVYPVLLNLRDERAVPCLLEFFKYRYTKLKRGWEGVLEGIYNCASGERSYPEYEGLILKIMQNEKEDARNRLLAAKVLAKIGSKEARKKVKEFTEMVFELYRKAYWAPTQQEFRRYLKELDKSPFWNEELVLPLLSDVIIELGDRDLMKKAIRFHLIDPEKLVNYLVGLGTPEAREMLEKLANNDKEYWPPYIPFSRDVKKKEELEGLKKEFMRVEPEIQKKAQEALRRWGEKK